VIATYLKSQKNSRILAPIKSAMPDRTNFIEMHCRGEETMGVAMRAFVRRFLMHYEIYRRYPLPRLSAFRNAWRNARA